MLDASFQPLDLQTRLAQLIFQIECAQVSVDVIAAERVQTVFIGVEAGVAAGELRASRQKIVEQGRFAWRSPAGFNHLKPR